MTAMKDPFSKPAKLSSQQKTDQTNSVVRNIIDAEVTAREKKTEKLRALRLARNEEDAVEKAAAKPGKSGRAK
ncbi:hypothetical protein GAO09_15155 [Rhizobiales bacterium RZME27]|jgi:hypothetical protein|uniref:Uncharacterized protein n=1 Tax=Endobacterium cereale TaxID=2663029 RepID=A0A6A8A9K5_9HYPH|nr:hypothetical protein [Endobacterium cereale]MEB2843363.1 hypothetical protein [Endobacterium cereale]MQY47374.1 hypothetical protein [Endobacterium cereale]